MLTTDDDRLTEIMTSCRQHGNGKLIGLNYRMTDVQAAAGLIQLTLRLEKHNEHRRRLAHHYNRRLSAIDGIELPIERPDVKHPFHLYSIRVDEQKLGMTRDQIIERLKNEHNIWCIVQYPCVHLLDVYRSLVDQFDPDVVLYVARSDTLTTYLDGKWENLGMPAFDRWTLSRFEQAIPVLSSRGAHVVFLTSPLYDSGEQIDGTPWPENDPSRVATDNRLITQAAGHYPDTASVIDLGQMLSPGGHFSSTVDGVPVRCADGVHLTVPGGEWVGSRILPEIVSLGQAHASTSTSEARVPLPPQAIPAWYSKLPCAS